MHNLAVTCSQAGRLDEAIPLFEEVVKLRKKKLLPDHPDTLASTDGLIEAYLNARRWAEAAAAAREGLEARTRKSPDDWSQFHTMSLLGAALAGQKKYPHAEPPLIAGYEGLKGREAKIPRQPEAACSPPRLGSSRSTRPGAARRRRPSGGKSWARVRGVAPKP